MALGSSLGHNAAAVGEPRTYGLELSYDFEGALAHQIPAGNLLTPLAVV